MQEEMKNVAGKRVKEIRRAEKERRKSEKEQRISEKEIKKLSNQSSSFIAPNPQYPSFPRTFSTNDIYARVHDNMDKSKVVPFVFNQAPRPVKLKPPVAQRIKNDRAANKIKKVKANSEGPRGTAVKNRRKQQKRSHDPDILKDVIEVDSEEPFCAFDKWNDVSEEFANNADFVAFNFDENIQEVQEHTSGSKLSIQEQKRQKSAKGTKRKREDDNSDDYPDKIISLDVLTPLPLPPWVDMDLYYSKDPNKMLNEEIHDYVKYMSPTNEERALRKFLLRRLEIIILRVFPRANVRVFGSYCTDLYLPSSDLDIVIMDDSAHMPDCLFEVLDAMKKNNMASKIEFIKAKVSIIKMIDSICGINVDISFNMPGGIESANIIRNYLNDPYIGEATKSLILIVKQFLVQRHLNEVFSGGIGSYALVCMIVSFLTMHPMIQAKQIKISKNIGVLLLEFFEFYGKCLNYSEVGIGLDLKHGGFHFNKWDVFRTDDNRISIQDPQDSNNDISRGSFLSRLVLAEFSKAYSRITSMIGAYYDRRNTPGIKRLETILGSIITIPKKLIEHRDTNKELFDSLDDLDFLDPLTLKGTDKNIPTLPLQLCKGRNSYEKRNEANSLKEIPFVDDSSDNDIITSTIDDDFLAMYEQDEQNSIDAAILLYKQENDIISGNEMAYDEKEQRISYAKESLSLKLSNDIDLTHSEDDLKHDITSYYKFQ